MAKDTGRSGICSTQVPNKEATWPGKLDGEKAVNGGAKHPKEGLEMHYRYRMFRRLFGFVS